jgi:hypothetical protein
LFGAILPFFGQIKRPESDLPVGLDVVRAPSPGAFSCFPPLVYSNSDKANIFAIYIAKQIVIGHYVYSYCVINKKKKLGRTTIIRITPGLIGNRGTGVSPVAPIHHARRCSA